MYEQVISGSVDHLIHAVDDEIEEDCGGRSDGREEGRTDRGDGGGPRRRRIRPIEFGGEEDETRGSNQTGPQSIT